MSKRTIIFGETLFRLSPLNHLRLTQDTSFDLYYGRAEAYLIASFSKFGFPVKFITVFSPNELRGFSSAILNFFGVDSRATIQGKTLGIYSFEQSAPKSSGEVVYDQDDSFFSTLKKASFCNTI